VVFTNQAGVSRRLTSVEDLKFKFEKIQQELGVQLIFLASFEPKSDFRKPNRGMWLHLTEKILSEMEIDKGKSFYCGDAAGRKNKPDGSKNDFSMDDLLFSANLNLKFCTPEMLFLEHPLNFNSNIPGIQIFTASQAESSETKIDEFGPSNEKENNAKEEA